MLFDVLLLRGPEITPELVLFLASLEMTPSIYRLIGPRDDA